MADKIIRIAAYSDPFLAEHAKELLQEAGIKAFLSGEATGGLFAGMGAGFSKFDLHVAEEDVERASNLLESLEKDAPEDDDEQSATGAEQSSTEGDDSVNGLAAESAIQEGPAPLAGNRDTEWAHDLSLQRPQVDMDAEQMDLSIRVTRDYLAERAFRAAFLGLFLCPPLLHLYSLWLLLQLSSLPDEISPASKWKYYTAMAIDLVILVSVALFILGVGAVVFIKLIKDA
jgi:hypothetical protein